MTRPIAAPLLSHLQGVEAHRVDCVMLQSRDGLRVGFTTSDVPQTADIGEGDETFDGGMTLSQLVLGVGFDASYFEMSGPVGPVLTRVAVDGGRWDDAEAWLFRMSPDVVGEIAPLMYGTVREARVEGNRFVLEVRSDQDRFNQTIGGVLSAQCDVRDYGDARCKKEVETVDATVTSVTDDLHFAVSFTGSYPNDYFNLGKTVFTSGNLVGTAVGEIEDWTAAGAIELRFPLVERPQVGDTLTLKRDCPRTRAACMERGNILNFRGEPDLSGSDVVLRAQIPGSGNA